MVMAGGRKLFCTTYAVSLYKSVDVGPELLTVEKWYVG